MTARNATHRRLCGSISTSHEALAESKSAGSAAGLAAPTCSSGIRPMTECQRCGRETDRQTLALRRRKENERASGSAPAVRADVPRSRARRASKPAASLFWSRLSNGYRRASRHWKWTESPTRARTTNAQQPPTNGRTRPSRPTARPPEWRIKISKKNYKELNDCIEYN
jgi:hypothetical protein